MLPSSGYFKTLPCPFFSENETCSRPFCHYKHEVKAVPNCEKKIKVEVTNIKQEPENEPVSYKPTPMPSYNPTPLALLGQKKSLPQPDYSISYQPTPLKEIKREKELKVKVESVVKFPEKNRGVMPR